MSKTLPKFLLTQEGATLTHVPEGYEALLLGDLALRENDVLHVSRDVNRAMRLLKHLEFFHPQLNVHYMPGWDCLPYDRVSPQSEIIAQRIDTLTSLMNEPIAQKPRLTVTTVGGLIQRVIPKEVLKGTSLYLKTGQEYERDNLIHFLSDNGYARRETVREWGEFAVRGGIMDVFPPGTTHPLRIDFFGEEVESIRSFDPLTQRSAAAVDNFTLKPMGEVLLTPQTIKNFRENYREAFGAVDPKDPLYNAISEGHLHAGCEHWLPLYYNKLETLLDYLPHAVVTIDHQADEARDSKLAQIEDHYKTRLEFTKIDTGGDGIPYHPLPPNQLYLDEAYWNKALSKYRKVFFTPFNEPAKAGKKVVDTEGKLAPSFASARLQKDGSLYEALSKQLLEYTQQGKKIFITGLTAGSAERLGHLLEEHDIKPLSKVDNYAKGLKAEGIVLAPLDLEHGFESPQLTLITEEDILGERLGRPQKKQRQSDMFLTEASSLEVGDLVVHTEHGIGRYRGLVTVDAGSSPHDCLEIEYHGGDKLFLPVENIDMLSRYGSSDAMAQLDKLGGTAWQARKAKAKKRIRIIADHLIKVAAERQLRKADVLTKPEGLYDEFCARFPYMETDDQITAIDDILCDLASGKPMDRLICGDVGFGKTEVALRAAFVTAAAGDQVAIVVPTTLLARQHFQAFQQRFKDTGLKVAQLSRLVKPAEAKKIKEQLALGEIDIIIGTHALFAKSVKFQKLGLLIVDEEQHFGVTQKERLKELKSDIHVLTLTATPIPRTLQMSLSGVRDMSLITTPPVDRLAVRTFVMPFDGMIIREAILREQFRGGQTFYVCPRVKDIDKVANRLQKFVPEAKFAIATGQMAPTELESVMTDFCDGVYDVLLSSNIIESGIDIPQANTIIIHHADMFGLSQLYQLRGRVGRSKTRGYSYLTLPQGKALTPEAQKRLEVMQSLDSLGAGFTVASHDMDIRGAGNLVGDEQSGHIKEVGVELYQHMLEEAVHAMKDKSGQAAEIDTHWTPQINLGVPVLIPESYVSDLGLRLGLYRRLSTLHTRDEIESFAAELIDRFGTLPEEVKNLLEVVHLKALCRSAGVAKLEAGPRGMVMELHKNEFKNPTSLIHYIGAQKGSAKIRPDQSVVFIRAWNTPMQRIKGAQGLVEDILGLV